MFQNSHFRWHQSLFISIVWFLAQGFGVLNCFSLLSVSRFHSIELSETALFTFTGLTLQQLLTVDWVLPQQRLAARCWAWTCSDKADSLTHSVATDILPFSPLIWNNCLHNELISIEGLSLKFCLEHLHHHKHTIYPTKAKLSTKLWWIVFF